MKCEYCGAENDIENSFCENCGKSFSSKKIQDFQVLREIEREMVPNYAVIGGLIVGVVVAGITTFPLAMILLLFFDFGYFLFSGFIIIPVASAIIFYIREKRMSENTTYKIYHNWLERYNPKNTRYSKAIALNPRSRVELDRDINKNLGDIIVKTPRKEKDEDYEKWASIKLKNVLYPQEHYDFIKQVINELEDKEKIKHEEKEEKVQKTAEEGLYSYKPRVLWLQIAKENLIWIVLLGFAFFGLPLAIATAAIFGWNFLGWGFLGWFLFFVIVWTYLLGKDSTKKMKMKQYVINTNTIDNYTNIETGEYTIYKLKPNTQISFNADSIQQLYGVGTIQLLTRERRKFTDDYKTTKMKMQNIKNPEEVIKKLQGVVEDLE